LSRTSPAEGAEGGEGLGAGGLLTVEGERPGATEKLLPGVELGAARAGPGGATEDAPDFAIASTMALWSRISGTVSDTPRSGSGPSMVTCHSEPSCTREMVQAP
jgi:hypothetical protein